jgi:hypothetical protein
MRGKPLKQLSNLFKNLIFTLKEVDFKFNYLISNELAKNGSVTGRGFKQIFIIINA